MRWLWGIARIFPLGWGISELFLAWNMSGLGERANMLVGFGTLAGILLILAGLWIEFSWPRKRLMCAIAAVGSVLLNAAIVMPLLVRGYSEYRPGVFVFGAIFLLATMHIAFGIAVAREKL